LKDLNETLRVLGDARAIATLTRLHAAADRQNLALVARFAGQLHRWATGRTLRWDRLESRLSDLYLALDPDNGVLCYLLARVLRARRIVEFGTSFGLSTIYLALAVRDNGGGVVIGTEFVPDKAAQARRHLEEAGLAEYVDLREGDALQTLQGETEPVDLLLNDGFPRYVLPVLQLLAPAMRPGSVALCGNAALFPADHAPYLAWVRDPRNGFCSSKLPITLAGEMSVRCAPSGRSGPS
jgi:predicted O-methyltransferase YrrM